MKNFLSDFVTVVLSVMTVFFGAIAGASGVAIVLQKPGLGLIFSVSAVVFAGLLMLTVKRKGGLGSFLAFIFPWW